MTRSTAVVVQVHAGGRPLLQTADSILRSRNAPTRSLLVRSPTPPDPPLLDSVAMRLEATVVDSLNAALRTADTRYLVLVSPGVMLDDTFLEEIEAAFTRDASVAAIAPAIRLQRPDATAHVLWTPPLFSAASVLNDTATVPPVFAVRRDVCESLGGFDESAGTLAEYEFWLRLTLARHKVAVFAEPVAARDIVDLDARLLPEPQHLSLFRAVLEKHAAAIGSVMEEVLIGREVRFGQMRERHRELIARRDAGLAELDRLRAEAAHLRAYIVHHGREALDWGDLRRTDPLSRDWGYDRGTPVDRRYIDAFLAAHSADVRGSVLEVQEDDFTRAYGGPRVTASSVLDVDASNPRATVIADLRCAPSIAAEQFDCVVLTQTLHVIDDMTTALRECYRILKPGGVLLATLPSASRVCLEYGRDGDFWRATPAGVRALFRSAFTPATIDTSTFGNVLTNVAFLHGVAADEVAGGDFTPVDPYFPALVAVRARKTASPPRRAPRGVVLLYHRVGDEPDVHGLTVPPAVFEAQLARLRAEFDVVSLQALLESAPEDLPDRAVALTFDDGYVDNLATVAPLLQKYGLPATFFVTTRWLEEDGEYWWDVLARAKAGGDAALHDVMVHATLEERDTRVEELRRLAEGRASRARPMRADEIRQLASVPNVTIGAHSVNHLALPDQRAEVARREIEESCATLTRLIGKPVDMFAYPYGAHDQATAAIVRATCRWGVACERGPLRESFDAALVPRREVGSDFQI